MKLTATTLRELITEVIEEEKFRWAKFDCYIERKEEEMKMEKDKKTKKDKPVSITTMVRVCDLKKVPAG